MLYSEKELNKRLKSGCALYCFYASEEALVRSAAGKALAWLSREDPEITVLDGPAPSVEEIVLAAGTISFFGGKRLVSLPLLRAASYSDKDLQELCETLADTENAVFVITCVMEEKYKERVDDFFAYRDNHNCERIYQEILKLDGDKCRRTSYTGFHCGYNTIYN